MKLSLITNDPGLAVAAEDAGVERILIDLERLGKADRQSGRDLFSSHHRPEDVVRVRKVLRRSAIMVRIDPLHDGSAQQIDYVIGAGADRVMLPFFHQPEEAQHFLSLVRGRVETTLLVETKEAAASIEELCQLPGLTEVHIGLNDLAISLGKGFLFDVIADDTIAGLSSSLRAYAMPFGFGGIGSLSRRDLPVCPELILAEQVCQGATRGWLGRTFREAPLVSLQREVHALRRAMRFWEAASGDEKDRMRTELSRQIVAASQARSCP